MAVQIENRFGVELRGDRRFVVARDVDLGTWCRVRRLEAELPSELDDAALHFEIERLRHARATVSLVEVDIEVTRLRQAITTGVRELDVVSDAHVWFERDAICLAIQVSGDPGSLVVARFGLIRQLTGGDTVDVVAFEHLVLGDVDTPAPILVDRVIAHLLATPEFESLLSDSVISHSNGALQISAARLVSSELFVRHGMKFPGVERLAWYAFDVSAGALRMRASSDPAGFGNAQGELCGAQALAALAGAHTAVGDRHLHALFALADPASSAEAATLVQRRLGRSSSDITALSVGVGLALRRGEGDAFLRSARSLVEALARCGRQETQVQVMLYVARALLTRSDPSTAVKWVDTALRVSPKNPAALQTRVRVARALGDTQAFEDGLTRLLAIARLRSVKARLHRELARVAREQRGDLESARRHLLEAVRLREGDAGLLFELGGACEEAGRTVEAIQAYRAAAKSAAEPDPGHAAGCLLAAARVWESALGDEHSALVDARRAATLAPHDTDARLTVRRLATLLGEPPDVEPLDPADIEDRPPGRKGPSEPPRTQLGRQPPDPSSGAEPSAPYPSAAALLAEARASGDPSRLADALESSVAADLDSQTRARLLSELGQLCFYELEDAERARPHLESALRASREVASADFGLLSALESIYEDRSEHEALLEVFGIKLATSTDAESRAVYSLSIAGLLIDRLGRPADALPLLSELLEGTPDRLEAIRMRAHAVALMGNPAQAISSLREALTLPDLDDIDAESIEEDIARWRLAIAPKSPVDDAPPPVQRAPAARSLDADSARIEELDAVAESGDPAAALRGVDSWLPSAREPSLRRRLLLRKGRWLLDSGADPRSALLPLKGGLILDPASAPIRLELLRAMCALGEVTQAVDQLREYCEARAAAPPPDAAESRRLTDAALALVRLPRGPVVAWVADLIRPFAPDTARAVESSA